MKIAMMIDSWWPLVGGGPVHVFELSKKLVLNHQCTVDIFTRALVGENGKRYFEREEHLNGRLKIYRLPPCLPFWNLLGRISYLFTAFYAIYKRQYDIIHSHAYLSGIPAHCLRKIKKAPVVFTVHGTGLRSWGDLSPGIKGKLMKKLEELILLKLKYTHVITVGKDFLDLARNHQNVTYIPNGVDTEKYNRKMRKDNDLLFVGRLHKQKSVDTLINAMTHVVMKRPGTKLKIVGHGDQQEKLRNLVEKLGFKSVVFTYVSGDGLVKEYLTSKIFVLPSLFEGFPLTVLEAWAAGIPVVATDVSGINEIVRHRVNGYLVSPKSPEELAKGILFALDHEEETREWIKEGRRLVNERYSWDEIVDRTYNLYATMRED